MPSAAAEPHPAPPSASTPPATAPGAPPRRCGGPRPPPPAAPTSSPRRSPPDAAPEAERAPPLKVEVFRRAWMAAFAKDAADVRGRALSRERGRAPRPARPGPRGRRPVHRRARDRGAPRPPGRDRGAGRGGLARLPRLLPAELPLPVRRLVHAGERPALRGAGRGAVRRLGGTDAAARAVAAGQGVARTRPARPAAGGRRLRLRRLPDRPARRLSRGRRCSGWTSPSPYLEEARRRSGAPPVQAAAERLPFADASLDAVTCVYLFHELPPKVRVAVAAEFARVLKPGGLSGLRRLDPGGRTRPELALPLARFPAQFHEPFYESYQETTCRRCSARGAAAGWRGHGLPDQSAAVRAEQVTSLRPCAAGRGLPRLR